MPRRRSIAHAFLYSGALVGLWRGAAVREPVFPQAELLVLLATVVSTTVLFAIVWGILGGLIPRVGRVRPEGSARELALAAGVAAFVLAQAVFLASAGSWKDGSLTPHLGHTAVACVIGIAAWLLARDRMSQNALDAVPRLLRRLVCLASLTVVVAFGPAFLELPRAAQGCYLVALVLAVGAVLTRTFLAAGALALLLAASFFWPYPVNDVALSTLTRSPNVLLVTIDTLRPDHLGVYGYERDTSPNLDRLARRSVVFEQAVTPVPETNPAHTSLLTGLHPGKHGAVANGLRSHDEIPTVAGKLAALGYETAAFTSAVVLDRRTSNLHRDFGYLDDRHPGWRSLPDHAFEIFEFRVARRLLGTERISKAERTAEQTTRAALDWLDRRRGKRPVFLWAHYFDPHGAYLPPEPYASRWGADYTGPAREIDLYHTLPGDQLSVLASADAVQHLIDQYDGEIAYTDHWVGRLIDAFDELGETAVIVTADHGESLGEHGYYFDHGNLLYDPSMRIPLILRLPGDREAGTRIPQQVRLMDVYPTIMELLERQIVEEIDGQSLIPLVAGDPDGPRDIYLAIRKLASQRHGNVQTSGLRTADGQKLIYTPPFYDDQLRSPGRVESYDLTTDPGELDNLADPKDVEFARRLAEMLQWHGAASNESTEEIELTPQQLEQLRSLGYVN